MDKQAQSEKDAIERPKRRFRYWKEMVGAAVLLVAAAAVIAYVMYSRRTEYPTLMAAVRALDVYDVQKHIEQGADIYAPVDTQFRGKPARGPVALETLQCPKPEVLEAFLDGGLDLDRPFEIETADGVHFDVSITSAAIVYNRHVAMLIEAGAPVNAAATDFAGTPLIEAIEAPNYTAARKLLEAGADVNATDSHHRTALHHLTMRNPAHTWDPRLHELLLSHGANPNARDVDGKTPLHYAAVNGSTETVLALIAHGADAQAKDGRGMTASGLAVQRNRQAIAEMLRERFGG